MSKKIYVYEEFSENSTNLMGTLNVDEVRGEEIYSFEYNEDWLKKSDFKVTIDPSLQLTRGRQYSNGKELFGIFKDLSPDRWGRNLMNRKEKIDAEKEKRIAKKLTNSDYLLGVHDKTRMGSLKLKLNPDGDFLSNDDREPIPPWTSLRTLENASREFEKDASQLNEKWLKELLLPGSSLGGSRSKAVVIDPSGDLWIAKFPSKNDSYDVGKWEKVVHDLAKLCRLNVPESKLEKFSELGSTFLVKRFDRDKERQIHFASAMTLLNKQDGDNDASYLDLVFFIKSSSYSCHEDLIELYKRIVFNMAVRNTDDHLRNHGFLLSKKGWKLSPLYDVNPVYYGDRLSLNINEVDNSISLKLLLEVAPLFDLNEEDSIKIVNEIKTIIRENWEKVASEYSFSRNEIEMMRDAFAFCYE